MHLLEWHYVALAGGILGIILLIWAASTRTKRAVGIDVGNSHIKIVEIEYGKQVKLRRFAILPTPAGAVQNGLVQDQALLAQTLEQVLRENKFYLKRVATVLTGQNLLIRTVELPAMPKKELQEAVKWQFDQHFQLRSEDTVSDYQVVKGAPGQPLSVMLVAMQKQPVLTMINTLRSAGMKATTVDIEPLAVLRALRLACKTVNKEGTVAVLDFGAGTTNVSIFNNGILRAARVMHFGSKDYNIAIMDELGLSFEEAEQEKVKHGLRLDSPIASAVTPVRDELFSEISRTINFYFAENRGETLSRVYMLGGGSLIIGLKPQLENYLNEFVSAMDHSFQITICNPLADNQVALPAGKMPVEMPRAPVEELPVTSEFVPRTRRQQSQQPDYDIAAIGVTLSVALGMALGEVSKRED